MGNRKIIDLSAPLRNTPPGFFPRTEIVFTSHEQGAKGRSKEYGLPEGFFPDNKWAAHETITLNTHSGTHLDSPWHYGPSCGGKPSRTIDQIPLEWCFGDGVVLNLSDKGPGEIISKADVEKALDKIDYRLKPFDIVLIRTDSSRYYLKEGEDRHPGMGRESTIWLIEQGIKVMGIDAKGWDRDRKVLLAEIKKGAPKEIFWEAHFVGREMEFCHLENLANLDAIPKPYGFKVAVFPIKIEAGSAGWVRAAAIIEE